MSRGSARIMFARRTLPFACRFWRRSASASPSSQKYLVALQCVNPRVFLRQLEPMLFVASIDKRLSTAASILEEPSNSDVTLSHAEEVERLRQIIGERDWNRAVDSALQRSGVRLTTIHVVDVIKRQKSPKDALWFFIWAALQRGYEHNAFTIKAITRIWGHETDLKPFVEILCRMQSKEYAWTASKFTVLIKGYGWAGLVDEASNVVQRMETLGFRPNEKHYGCLLDALLKENRFQTSQSILKRMKQKGLTLDVVTYTTLIDGWCKGGQTQVACDFFDEMLRSGIQPNLMTYTALFRGLCKANATEKALQVYREVKDGDLDSIAFNTLMDGLCEISKVETAYEFFLEMIKNGHQPVSRAYSALIDALCKAHKFEYVEKLLQDALARGIACDMTVCLPLVERFCLEDRATEAYELLSKLTSKDGIPDATCNMVLSRLCKTGKAYTAFNYWKDLRLSKSLNLDTYQVLLDGLFMEGRLLPAKQVYLDMMSKGHVPSVGVYCALLNGLCRAGNFDEAYKVTSDMVEKGCVPNCDVFNSLIHGLSKAKKMSKALQVLEKMEAADCLPTIFTFTTLIYGFCKVEAPEAALLILDKMSKRGFAPDIATYGVLIDELCKVGKADAAYDLFLEMREKGFVPSVSSYGTLIVSLCDSNKVNEAYYLMLQVLESGQKPGSLACEKLVDSLSKGGRCQDALKISESLGPK